MLFLAFISAFAFLNRARGTQLFGLTDSTIVGRLVSMMGMALLTSFLFMHNSILMLSAFLGTWAFLMLWCSPLWDKFWNIEIGNSDTHSRLYGLMQMTIRMSLAVPTILFIAGLSGHQFNTFYAFGALTLGFPYYLYGYIRSSNPIPYSEYTVGSMLGTFIWLAAL